MGMDGMNENYAPHRASWMSLLIAIDQISKIL